MTENPQNAHDWQEIWKHFNRMQKRVMSKDSIVSRKEFFAESEKERLEFHRWMEKQCGEYACWM